jgi:hypothetical protein
LDTCHHFLDIHSHTSKEHACKTDNIKLRGGGGMKKASFRIVENKSQHFSDNCLQIRSFKCHLLLQGLDTCHHFWTSIAILVRSVHARQTKSNWGVGRGEGREKKQL